MNFRKFKWENKLKKLEKAMGQFWPTAAALTVGGLPWLSGPKDETGLLGRPTNLAHGSMPDVVTCNLREGAGIPQRESPSNRAAYPG
jgi:hypothetical protein